MYLQSAILTIEDRVIPLKSVAIPDGLNFSFSYEKIKFNPFANINVTLYNINEKTAAALTKKKEGNKFFNVSKIKCEAGYQGSNRLIFSGTVTQALTSHPRGEKVTNVIVSNYTDELIRGEGVISYKKAPRLSKALQDLGSQIGFIPNTKRLNSQADLKISQTSFSGTITEFMTGEAAVNPNIGYNIINDTVEVYTTGVSPGGSGGIQLNKDTGLIGVPTLTSDNLVKCQSLFNPNILIDTPMIVESEKFHQRLVNGGVYKLRHNFNHVGSVTEIEILPFGQVVPRNNLGIGI